jgi:hypothetical protein
VTSAFLAMACWKSGRQDEAREALARAKALAANPIWSSWTYYKDVLREATDLIEGSRAAADAPR